MAWKDNADAARSHNLGAAQAEVVDEKKEKRPEDLKADEVLQRTETGYEVTKVDEIPLSEKAGEKRLDS